MATLRGRAGIQTPSQNSYALERERYNKSGDNFLALAQGNNDPIIWLPFDLHALNCARRRGIGGYTQLVAQHRPWALKSSGPGMLTWASASSCQCHRGEQLL